MCFERSDSGRHSALFMHYVDDHTNPIAYTRIRIIEGNTDSRVSVKTRTHRDALSMGSTRQVNILP